MTNKIIEGLEPVVEFLNLLANDGDGICDNQTKLNILNFAFSVTAAISALREREWVEIEEIPEEWKDGRVVFVKTLQGYFGVGTWEYDGFFRKYCFAGHVLDNQSSSSFDLANLDVTHARLPSPPMPEG